MDSSKTSAFFRKIIPRIKLTKTRQPALLEKHNPLLNDDTPPSYSESIAVEIFCKIGYLKRCFHYNKVLLAKGDQTDFTDAVYVDGYNTKRRYICCQPPLRETAYNFWQLVWTHKTRAIVMLTNTCGANKEVCYQYWNPIEKLTMSYGQFKIETKVIKTYRYYVVTSLLMTDESGKTLDIKHFNFTDWPIDDYPKDSAEFRDFVLSVRKEQSAAESQICDKDKQYPSIILHSSAGLYRAVMFYMVDIGISRNDEYPAKSVYEILPFIHKQRFNCLQSTKYKAFCCLTLLNHIQSQ